MEGKGVSRDDKESGREREIEDEGRIAGRNKRERNSKRDSNVKQVERKEVRKEKY